MSEQNFPRLRLSRTLLIALLFVSAQTALAQTTAFTYQGRLTDGGAAASGSYDLQFALFDSAAGGAQVGATQTLPAVTVAGGVFTVQLDFGVNAFPGANRFLEIGVRPAGGSAFTTLAPRQQISSTPYAIRTLSAASADAALNAAQLGGVAASQYVQTTDGRLSDARPPTAGSSNYIQNTTAQQAANLNISGSGIFVGNLGVGGSPTNKLTVNVGPGAPVDSGVTIQGSSSTFGDIGLRIKNTGAGGNEWYIDSTSQGSGYGPGKLAFVNTPGSSPPVLTLKNNGNVGIGDADPTPAKLVVRDASVGTAIAGYTSTTGSAVYGENTGGGWAVYANGNAGQALSKGGFVKAAMLVEENGQISLCYNSQTTGTFANTPLCGFSVTHVNNINGFYNVTFPFAVNTRFFSVTPALQPNGVNGNLVFPQVRPIDATTLQVRLYSPTGGDFPGAFYLIVF